MPHTLCGISFFTYKEPVKLFCVDENVQMISYILYYFGRVLLFHYIKFVYVDNALVQSLRHVRMAERSKAPDSSLTCAASAYECSGLQLEAWVRIPLLTRFFQYFFHIT